MPAWPRPRDTASLLLPAIFILDGVQCTVRVRMAGTLDEKKVRYISLVRKEGGEPVLSIPFREMSVDPDLVASFVLAIIIFENRQLKTFTKEGYVVVIEEGQYVVGLLIVDRVDDDTEYRRALVDVIQRFEERYEGHFLSWRGDIRPFREFALDILSVFPYCRFDWDMIPRLRVGGVEGAESRPIPWSVGTTDEKLHRVLGFVNGKRTVAEICDASGLPDREVAAIFSMLLKYGWVTMTRRLDEDTVLIKMADPPMRLLGAYGEQLTKLVDLCDGTRTLREVCGLLPYDMAAVMTVARNLVNAGVLAHYEPGEQGRHGGQ